jgi:phosphatidylinositol alpha-mannosyltransferase
MKIAIVCPYSIDVPGGVQQQAIGLVDGIRTAGHQAWLVAPGTMGPPDVKLLGPAVRVRANGSVAPIALRPGTASKTRSAIAAADVVHIHEPLVFPTSSAALLGAGPPAVGTFHADPSPWMRRAYRVAAPVLRRTLSKLAAATAVSEVAAAAVRGLVDEISLIPNGIDVGAYSIEIERHPTRVVFLGRDEPRKGLDILLAAWPAVRTAVSDAQLVVLGVDRPSPSEGIRYLGTVLEPEKRRQLAAAGIFCGPNLGSESFGISVVEAMAAGCVLLLSDLAAFRRVAGPAAHYFAVGDPQQLAVRLISILKDQAGSGVRSVVRQAAERYDWANVLPAYLDLYERVGR